MTRPKAKLKKSYEQASARDNLKYKTATEHHTYYCIATRSSIACALLGANIPIVLSTSLSNLLSKHFGRVASVCTPHASVLSGDAFNHGLTRSRTDFSIYADPSGYNGTDLQAPLLLILPQFDSIPFIDGQKKSFWSMVETERGTGRAMLSVDWLHEKSLEVSAVFFDPFAAILIVFSKNILLILDVVVLILLPGPCDTK